jgi:hypothetical protein
MRPLVVVAVLGTGLVVGSAWAQDSADQPAGTAQPKKHSSSSSAAIDALTEHGPERPNALQEANREAALRKKPETAAQSGPTAQPAPAPVAPALPTVQAVPPGPPQKKLSGEEFSLIHVGSSLKEVLAVLGPPSSRIVVPDDDGHLRESFQYWVKGAPMGTVRLDNGRVVQIETKPQ